MSLRGPSVLFPAVTAINTALAAASWPQLTVGGNRLDTGVDVLFGSILEQPSRESVIVTGLVDDDSREWDGATVPASQRQSFSTLIVVVTNIPNRTAAEAWARLQVLCETLEATFRDFATGRPIIPDALALAGVYQWTARTASTDLGPLPDHGYVASARVFVSVQADY